jgi:HD-GYP domain-containing protein (c-di-GMP phosphodiesterase class II)
MTEKLSLKLEDEHRLLSAALIHDIGAASSLEERRKLANPSLVWTRGEDVYVHAEKGFDLLHNSDTFSDMARAVRHHHDRWDGANPSGLSGAAIPLAGRIIHLADRVEINVDKSLPILLNAERVRALIREDSGKEFDPELVDVFMDCSTKESFWLDQTVPEHASDFNSRMDLGCTPYSVQDMLNVAKIFATIIDRMSRFTATHSRSVSGVAVFLARQAGFSQNELHLMRIAGLLHDLGKLSIPNAILEKPGALTVEERLIVRQHTFYTYRILEQIEKFEAVAGWAAWHHETLDGQGYPFRLDESQLSLGARIMAVADIFVALAENRPYREKLPRETVTRIMGGMVANRKISGPLVESLFDGYAEAERVVRSMEGWDGRSDPYEPQTSAEDLEPAAASSTEKRFGT